MHQLLYISDILLQVFVHISQLESRKSLAALARTCKTFHELAMDLLWASTDFHGIQPLFGCVTRLHPLIYCDESDESDESDSDTELKCPWSQGVEPLSEHEVHQFLRHAARVRSLDIWAWTEHHFHLLAVIPIGTCVFPRLLSLDWRVCNDTRLDLFLHPTLRRCVLRFHFPLVPFIATYPVLESLSIGSRFNIEHTTNQLSLLSDTIRSCEHLKHLKCPPLDYEAWKHLSELPTLVTLSINGEMDNLLDRDNVNFAPFLNITALYFCVHSAADIITLIQRSQFPSLKKFNMHVDALLWAEAEQLFHALSRCKETLEGIIISAQESIGHSLTAIRHFLCFVQLRTLDLGFPVHLDNDLLLEAIASWPYIRHLVLGGLNSERPTVTFGGLFSALRQCPHLHTLELPIDAVNIDIDPEAKSFQHTSLRYLDLSSFSHIADPEAVARIIFSMFPCIDGNGVDYNFHEPSLWPKVNDFLAQFAAGDPRIKSAASTT
ncbi:hypothetical protein K503DRAFT_868405 [Rhizopogon vinicolor AM-OR11-026]|uniref:F-box domain-containing protein n=1 Tax=Rhizopogon vinicolor AM-OR11-026 TaxID=1314800 RepID=A0A1B7MRL8_9AGAM|nr:hypothetical protein K503DRAFT_868405 [Rhizopogon vinicolor AM-OR11-026]